MHFSNVIYKKPYRISRGENVTAVSSTVLFRSELFRSESKSSGFHTSERPRGSSLPCSDHMDHISI